MRNKGFTIMELMIVLVIIIILSVIAIPTIGDSLRSMRAQNITSQIVQAIVSRKAWPQ